MDAGTVSDSVTMGGHERLVMTTGLYRFLTSRLIAPWALQGVQPHGEVLEIGGGVGAMAQHLLRTFPDLQVVETDFDAEMCSAAARTLGPFGTRASVEQADATRLPFDDDRFDFVLTFLMLHHTGDWRQALREAIRVLRPDGRLVGFDVVAGAPLHHSDRFTSLMKSVELNAFMGTLPVSAVCVRPGLAKTVVRFLATKD
jgi:ubiquinone/menaquinone biosynthesis C-methylase UbiE